MKFDFLMYKLNNMSLRDKIGQMIMFDYRDSILMNKELESILTTYNPGGFILFRSNIEDYKQTYQLLSDIKNATNTTGFIAVDQEGGRVQRLGARVGFPLYPPMAEVGKSDVKNTFELGKKMGEELNGIGVNMDMAPILDIYSNLENRVIGDRAFGTDADTVIEHAFAYADGLIGTKIIPVGKHFPGHGDTFKDSHAELPVVEKSLEDLKKLELRPFKEAAERNLPGLMAAHIAVPNITGDNTPTSLSSKMINGVLRKDLGYKGIIMSDSLKMKALTKFYTNQEIYLKTIEAGHDILLMPSSVKEAFDVLYREVNEGRISIDRINNSVYKILSLKFDYGLLNEEYKGYLNSKKYIKIKRKNI